MHGMYKNKYATWADLSVLFASAPVAPTRTWRCAWLGAKLAGQAAELVLQNIPSVALVVASARALATAARGVWRNGQKP